MVRNKQQPAAAESATDTSVPVRQVSAESVLDLAPDAVVVIDIEGIILHLNRQTERLFGYARRELVGHPLELLIPERFRERFRRRFREHFDQHRRASTSDSASFSGAVMGAGVVGLAGLRSLAVQGRRHNGDEFAAEVTLSPLASEQGEVLVIGSIRDTGTLQRETGSALLRSEEWFRSMADTAPVLLWVADTDSLVTFLNEPWLRFTGRRLQDELGNGWAEGVHPDDFDRCLQTYHTSFAARQSFTMEYRLRRHDGEYGWLVDTGVPRFAEDGTFAGYIGSAIDITERMQLKQEREDAEAREWAAREVARRLDEFFALAAHDIRSPVTAVAANVQTATRRFDRLSSRIQSMAASEADPSEQLTSVKESLNATSDSVGRLIRLTNLLFDMAQARFGKLEVQMVPCDLNALVREQVEAGRVGAHRRTIHLQAPDYQLLVAGDKDRLGQVLANYISNAFKYSRDDQPVEVSLSAENGAALVSVRDRGPGLAPEEQEKVWEILHRAPGVEPQSSSGGTGSLGLGLHISRLLIDLHHGEVGVHSRQGQGATFYFKLPLLPDTPETYSSANGAFSVGG
jgi:PAS domain S-box-containing protein